MLLEGYVEPIRARLEEHERQRAKARETGSNFLGNPEARHWRRIIEAYDTQQKRTLLTQRFFAAGALLEWFPTCLVTATAILLTAVKFYQYASSHNGVPPFAP